MVSLTYHSLYTDWGASLVSHATELCCCPNTTSLSFTVTAPVGGMEAATIDDSNTANMSQSGNTITVTAKKKGTTYIRIKNKLDNSKEAVYTITVARDYEGQAVWKYGGLYIAPVDAGTSEWTTNLTRDYCSNKIGATWVVPTGAQYRTILGTSDVENASQAVYDELKSRGVFVVNKYYWSTTTVDDRHANYLILGHYSVSVTSVTEKNISGPIRCVSN